MMLQQATAKQRELRTLKNELERHWEMLQLRAAERSSRVPHANTREINAFDWNTAKIKDQAMKIVLAIIEKTSQP